MCAGIHHPTRGGTRGGKDQFDWEDVKTDKDRECYLGHSMMAPVGRWQKGKDLSWYTKKSKSKDYHAILEAERAAVKRAEEEAMAAALGLKPAVKTQQPLSRQEAAEVFRRQSQDEPEGGEERVKGVGFSGSSQRRRRVDSSSNDLGAIFEHDTGDDVRGSVPASRPESSQLQPLPDSTTSSSVSDRAKLKARLRAYLAKKADKSKKKKKEKKSSKQSKKSHRKRTSSSDSEEWVEVKSSGRRDPPARPRSRERRDPPARPRSRERSDSEERRQFHRHSRRDEGSHSRDQQRSHLGRRNHRERSESCDSDKRGADRRHRRHEHSPPSGRKRGRYEH